MIGSPKYLGFFLECNGNVLGSSWSCKAQAELKIVNHKDPNKSLKRSITHLFFCKRNQDGYDNFIEWTELTNPDKGFILEDAITLEVDNSLDFNFRLGIKNELQSRPERTKLFGPL